MNHNPSPHPQDPSALSEGRARSSSHIVRAIVLSVIAVVLIGGGGLALWHYPMISEGSAQSAASQKKGRASTSEKTTNPFIRHAEDGGILACKDTYAALGAALAAGANYMVQTETANNDPDEHSMQGLVGLSYPSQGEDSGPAAGMVFVSPTTAGKNCEGSLVRVVPFQQSCQAAANLLPKGSREGQQLSGVYTFALPDGGNAMLLPAGANCVVVSVIRGAG